MMSRLVVGIAIALAFSCCGSPAVRHGASELPPELPLLSDEAPLSAADEQHHVLSVVLNDIASGKKNMIVVVDSTLSEPDLEGLMAYTIKRDSRPAPADFDSLYSRLWLNPRVFKIEAGGLRTLAPVRLVGLRDSVVMGKGEFGIHAFMSVVFNADSTRALVYSQVKCGMLCGWGEVILLARRPGRAWVIWFRRELWVS